VEQKKTTATREKKGCTGKTTSGQTRAGCWGEKSAKAKRPLKAARAHHRRQLGRKKHMQAAGRFGEKTKNRFFFSSSVPRDFKEKQFAEEAMVGKGRRGAESRAPGGWGEVNPRLGYIKNKPKISRFHHSRGELAH